MITCGRDSAKVGDTIAIDYTTGTGRLVPPQKAIVKRVATKEEFIQFWMSSPHAEKFKKEIEEHGEPPAHYNFYEVDSD